MPTYDYKCNVCKYRFEEFQSILSKPITICPRCGGKVERLISGGAGLIFKGAGFYETDYKRKSNGNGGGSYKSAPVTAKTESSTESK
ncbi:zinc ribbon domain-containing protein [bacterium]|nr:zinc ribbon domain-containing protein [bacterium]